MGRKIGKKTGGMNLKKPKISLILIFTIILSIFIGVYSPKGAVAATYYMKADSTTNLTADGTCNLPAGAPSATTTYPVYTTMGTTEDGVGSRYYPAITNGTPTVVIKMYSPVYTANAVDISNISASFAIRPTVNSDTVQINLYDYDPAGAAGNKTLVATGTSQTVGTAGTTVTKTWAAGNFTISGTGRVALNHRLLVEVLYSTTVTSPRFYFGITGALTSSNITVTETPVSSGNLTVANGTNPANANAPQSSTNNALDSFTLAMSAGTATVSTMTVTGSANFNATNIPTNGVKIYRDAGTIGAYDSGVDTLISSASTAIAGNATTVTVASESVTTSAANYLVTVDMNAGATLTNTFTGTVTAATGTGLGTPTYSDSASGTLTVSAAQTLTIGNGTDPANANTPQSSLNKALDAFTLAVNSGTGTVSTMTVTGSANFNATNIPTNGVKIYRDAGTIGTYDSGVDTLISSSSTAISANVTTVTLTSAESVTTSAANYLVTVDMNAGAVLTQTFTGTISAATGSGIGTPVDNDTTSATLTVTAAQLASTITSCGGCHGYGATYTDGTARNTPTGKFQGSHNKHVATYSKVCSVCHVAPATETSADYNHRNGTIQMANPINANAGATYSKAASSPYSFAQTNAAFSGGTCSSTYCHSDGTSATTPAGTILSNTSIAWGGSTACNSCHAVGGAADGRPFYTEPAPKANKHQSTTHSQQTCDICHSSVTYSGGVYTPNTLHNNGAYNIQASLGYTPGTAAAGGTCATPGCHGSVNWGGALGCVDCHLTAQTTSAATQLLDPAVTQRRAIVPEFTTAGNSNHKRSATPTGTVTNNDCGVCHMEGDATTGAINATYHKNGRINLRDPDTGLNIKGVTWSGTGAGSYASTANDAAPVRFSRNLGALEGTTDNQNAGAIMINLCLHCHDAGGATNAAARVPGGVVGKPFNTTVAANPGGTVLDVSSQFATTNRTYHPILGKQNNSYAANTRMAVPWNGVKTTGNSTSWGYLMTCWDCHATPADTGTITKTVTAHGSAITAATGSSNVVELRGVVWRSGAVSATNNVTLCVKCHALYDTSTTTNHSTGSAFSASGSSSMSLYLRYACTYCHSSNPNPATAVRPTRSGDVHGYNTAYDGTALAAGKGYAFIRSVNGTTGLMVNHLPLNAAGVGYTPTCAASGTVTITNGTTNCNQSMGTYTVGGTY